MYSYTVGLTLAYIVSAHHLSQHYHGTDIRSKCRSMHPHTPLALENACAAAKARDRFHAKARYILRLSVASSVFRYSNAMNGLMSLLRVSASTSCYKNAAEAHPLYAQCRDLLCTLLAPAIATWQLLLAPVYFTEVMVSAATAGFRGICTRSTKSV